MKDARFEAEVVEGHKGVAVVLVPFDPEDAWKQKPVRLAGRRHGWLVEGTVNGAKVEGYVGKRWGRFFVMLDEQVRDAARIAVGDRVSVVLSPTSAPGALARALEQSKQTTQPGKARADATSTHVAPKRGAVRTTR